MRRLFLGLAATLLSAHTAAETLFGLYAGAGSWKQETSGAVVSGVSEVDVREDLGLDDELNNLLYLAVEHGVPLLPNVRAQYADIDLAGDNRLSRNFEFNGASFALADDVATDLALEQTDVVLYYELLDSGVSLDLGLAARWVDGQVAVRSSFDSAQADFTGVLPMLYGRARIDLPFTGLWIGAQLQGLGYDGNRLLDGNAQLGWNSEFGFGAELGWRRFELTLKDFDEIDRAELDIDGPYFALNYRF